MEKFTEIKNVLTWESQNGKFEATLINGNITDINFCEPGTGPGDCGKCLNSTDYKFLKNVHEKLGQLFDFMDEENKRMGYKYAYDKQTEQSIEPEIVTL